MLKLRVIGTPEEIERSLESLAQTFEIHETSGLYPCRSPNEDKVRVYLEVEVPEAKRSRNPKQGRG
jgi:hypothetical protein